MVREQSVTSQEAAVEEGRESSSETVSLLSDLEANHRAYHTNSRARQEAVCKRGSKGAILKNFTYRIARGSAPLAKDALRSIPAVILGTLLNILDGISCEYLVA